MKIVYKFNFFNEIADLHKPFHDFMNYMANTHVG